MRDKVPLVLSSGLWTDRHDLEKTINAVVSKYMGEAVGEMFDPIKLDGEPEFDGYTALSVSADDDKPLTFDSFIEATLKLKKPDMHYATSEFISRGDCFHIEKGDLHPEYFVFNKDDFDDIESELKVWRTLIPLKDYKSSDEDVEAALKAFRDRVFGRRHE